MEEPRHISEFSKAMVEVAQVLPRAQLHSEIYQTDRMKQVVTHLYAQILVFLCQVLKWHRRKPFLSIINPFDVKFKGVLEEVRQCATAMDEVASSAERAEIRGLHIMAKSQDRRLDQLERSVTERLCQLKGSWLTLASTP